MKLATANAVVAVVIAPAPSDADIMERLAAGEIGALGELYDRHQASVRRFVARMLGRGADDIDDLVHSTFLAAAKSASKYEHRSTSARAWLMGIAMRLIKRRRTAFRRFLEVLGAFGENKKNGTGAESQRSRSSSIDPRSTLDARSDLEKALTKISDAKRITLLMAEVEGMSCQEISEALDIPIGTVWTRLHMARRELRDLLQVRNQ